MLSAKNRDTKASPGSVCISVKAMSALVQISCGQV